MLKFAVEYWGIFKHKDGSFVDEQVTGINTKELFADPQWDEINVHYILRLLDGLRQEDDGDGDPEGRAKRKKAILDMLGKETLLRSKRKLIDSLSMGTCPSSPQKTT